MPLRMLFLTLALMGGVETFSQPQRITLHLPHTTLRKIIDTLEVMGRYQVDYPGNAELYRDIYCWVDSATFEETIQKVVRGFSLHADFFTRNGVEFARITPIHTLTTEGKIYDELGQPVDDANVRVKDTHIWVVTDRRGFFRLDHIADTAVLEISGVNIRLRQEAVRGRTVLGIRIRRNVKNLPGLTLSYNDGYQRVKAAFTTGSYAMEDRSTIEKVVNRDLFAHVNGQLTGLTPGGPGNPLGFGIHGRNTLLGSGTPLLVVDNFPYAGRTDDINIYDLQSINVLKDAVGAGVWGAYSGNGVVVLSSLEGQYNQEQTITFTANTTVTGKPNLSYAPRLGSAGYLAADSILVSNHVYDGSINNPTFAINPGVALFWRRQNGMALPGDAAALSRMAGHNSLDDLSHYYYHSSVTQQYHLSVEGGSTGSKYYVSVGYDRDPTPLVRNGFQRVTLHGAYTVRPGLGNLEIALSGNLAAVNTRNNNNGNLPVAYPFAALADASGQPLSVAYKYNPAFVDTAGNSYPLDWHYRPLQELALADDESGRVNGHLQATIKYHVFSDLSVEVLGRWMKGHSFERDLYDPNSFFVRDLVNTYAQPKANGQGLYYPVPIGAILITADTDYTAYNARTQLRFHHATDSGNQWSVFAGAELDGAGTAGQTQRIYGHDNPVANARMDLTSLFPTPFGSPQKIPTNDGFINLANRAVSLYSNTSYIIRQNYTFYAAFRMDASNFVGVPTNRRWGPFWSAGISHNINTHGRDTSDRWTPALKMRLTYGCNGNVSNRTAYLITQSNGDNAYHVEQSGIASPPDPSLGWERTYILNAGIDFGFFRDSLSRHGRLSGSLDLYQRRSVDLLNTDTLTPSSGVAAYTGNTGGITGNGIDLVVNSVNTRGAFKWTSTLLFSVARDWISRDKFQPVSPWSYVSGQFFKLGKSSTPLFTYPSARLDAVGNPRGYLNGVPSTDYLSLMENAGGGLKYNGSRQPTVFGTVANTFFLGHFSLSARLIFKAGYSFLRPSIDYYSLAMGLSPGHRDLSRRWQAAGDEQRTSVPSLPATQTLDQNRDLFYLGSSSLATRADQVRWQDCSLGYEWIPHNKAPFKQVLFYFYVNNIGLLWRANKYGIDPDAAGVGDLPASRTWSVGARFKL